MSRRRSTLTGVLAVLVILAILAGQFYVNGIIWQLFLHLDSFWLACVLPVFVGAVSWLNIPLARWGQERIYINATGGIAPIVLGFIAWKDIGPSFSWVAAGLCIPVFATSYGFCEVNRRGVQIQVIPYLIWNLVIALALHFVSGTTFRETLFWGFTIQYTTMLAVDITALMIHHRQLPPKISIGGAALRDALVKAPVSALTTIIVLQWLFWGGLADHYPG